MVTVALFSVSIVQYPLINCSAKSQPREHLIVGKTRYSALDDFSIFISSPSLEPATTPQTSIKRERAHFRIQNYTSSQRGCTAIYRRVVHLGRWPTLGNHIFERPDLSYQRYFMVVPLLPLSTFTMCWMDAHMGRCHLHKSE